MAKRIHFDDKYLVIAEDLDITDDKRNPGSNVYVEKNGTLFIFYRLAGNVLIESIDFADIRDEEGLNYTDIATFTKLVEDNTGDVARDFWVNVATGVFPEIDPEFKFGENPTLGVIEEIIWHAGGDYLFLPLGVAETLDAVSTEAVDTNGGLGAWDLVIFGLDIAGFEQSELVLLDGLTPVTTTKSFSRVNRAIVLHSGTATAVEDANQGTINISATTSLNLLGQIGIHDGQTTQCVYTVPKGKTGYATGISFSIGQGKECRFVAKFRNCITNNCAFSTKYSLTIYESTIFGDLKTPLRVPELTDIVITGKVSSLPTVTAHASFGMLLIDN